LDLHIHRPYPDDRGKYPRLRNHR